jgi:hypothetical protein
MVSSMVAEQRYLIQRVKSLNKAVIRKVSTGCIICLFLLMPVPMISSNEIPMIEEKNVTPTEDTVELYISGGFAFHWTVVNHKDEPVSCKIDINMKNFLEMENDGWEYFTVSPHSNYSNWNDCYPMPFFHTYVTLTAFGEKTLKRNGVTLLGFNIFLTKEIIDEFDTSGEA